MSDDPARDGLWQRRAADGLQWVLDANGFAAGILIAITPAGRIIPVMMLPDAPEMAGLAAELLRVTLEQLEAGQLRRGPKAMPPEDGGRNG